MNSAWAGWRPRSGLHAVATPSRSSDVLGVSPSFVSLGGSAYAVNTVRSTDIVDGEVKSVDIGNNEIGSATSRTTRSTPSTSTASSAPDVVDGSLTGADIGCAISGTSRSSVGRDEVINGADRRMSATRFADLAAMSACHLAEFLAARSPGLPQSCSACRRLPPAATSSRPAAIGSDHGSGTRSFVTGWMCDEGESQQELLRDVPRAALGGPSIRPVPFTSADGGEGLRGSPRSVRRRLTARPFAADVDEATAERLAPRSGGLVRCQPCSSASRLRPRRWGILCRLSREPAGVRGGLGADAAGLEAPAVRGRDIVAIAARSLGGRLPRLTMAFAVLADAARPASSSSSPTSARCATSDESWPSRTIRIRPRKHRGDEHSRPGVFRSGRGSSPCELRSGRRPSAVLSE